MRKIYQLKLILLTIFLSLYVFAFFAPALGAQVTYCSHISNVGWLNWVSDGQTSGSPGSGNQIEAVKIQRVGFPSTYHIDYQAHVSYIGWQGWVSDGQTAGTTGQGKAIEAIQIKLRGFPSNYHVKYRAYVQNSGWQGWVSDGATAGTTGQGKVLEAIQLSIIYSVNPTIAMSPMSGPPGTTFTQWGTGFTPNSTATLHFRKPDGTEHTPIPQGLDPIGHFNITYTAPSNKEPGIHTWWGVDDSTGIKSNEVSYEITPIINPTIAMSPMSGPPGTTFAQWGTGFTPNSTATLHFRKPDGTEHTPLPQGLDPIGHFEITYTAPLNKEPGTHTWWGVDDSTGIKSNEVSYEIIPIINPTIAMSPMSGPPGTTFTQWGTGFTPNSTATLHFRKPDGTEHTPLSQGLDPIGHFEITYTAPLNKEPGTHTWWGVDDSTGIKSNEVSYEIIPIINPTIAMSPMSGPPGTTFAQWGTGFTPNSTATLHFRKPDGTEHTPLPQGLDPIGHFEITYTAPSNKEPGTHTWWGVDDSTGIKSNEVSYEIIPIINPLVILKLETTPASVRPGDRVRTEVHVQNGDNPRLAYVSARVSGPMGDESDLGYTSYQFATNETKSLAFQYTVPADADLGMYDLEAQLYEDCAGTCSNPIGLSFVADDAFEVSDEADIAPPAAIDDLSAESGDNRGEIKLSWTATGDDDYTGKSSGYIVKYATVPVTEVNWGSVNTYEQNWMPEVPGVGETHILSGFPPGQELFFALKAVDDVLNASFVSNTASAEASSAEGANYVDIPRTNFRIIAENINYTSDSKVEATGNVSLDELIYFTGLVRIDLENAIISGEGNAFIPDVPLMGEVCLFKAGFEFDLGELIESKIEAISRVAGIDLQINSMEFLWKDLKPDGIKISAKMKLPDYLKLVSGAIAVDDLVISRTDGISGTIDLDPEPEKLGIQINGCNWKLRDGMLSFDSQRRLFNGHGKLDMAKFDLTADISFIEGQLYGVGMCYSCPEPGKIILIASGVPIVFLQEVCGEVENIPDPSKLILKATADITAGPPIQDYYLAGLDNAGMEVDISSRATISGTLILGGFYELAYAEAYLDWHDVIFGANGDLNALDIFTAYTTLTIDAQNNISGSGVGNLSVPDVWYYWPLRGKELANVLGLLDNNGIKGEVEVQLLGFGSLSAAFGFDWKGNFSVATNLESLGSKTYMASQQRLLSLEGQLMPVYVPEGMEVIYIKVTWTGDGDSTVELVKPDSTRITPGSCGADPNCYYQDDAPQEAWYALRYPDSGQWQVDIIDPANLGDIAVDLISSNSKPLIQLTEPSVDISTITSVDISWVDSDPDDNASVSLWYDVDQQGYDGSLIISGINEDDGADSYVWDVTSIPTGRYYVYAQIDDGKNASLRCYAPGMVEVVNPLYPGTPTNLQATVNGKVVELSWDAVADCVYMLHYTDNITSEVYDSYFSLTDENHWIADPALAGKEVKFAIQAVQAVEIGEGQTEMRASLVSAPVVVTIPGRPGISIEPAVIEFGDVSPETSTVKVATISNMGNEDLMITCLKFVGSDKEAFNVNRDCPLTIGPGANEQIGIELIPNKQGAYSALLQIFSDDPQKAVCEIGLSATVNYLCGGDFDDDGDVDGSDLAVFAADFGRTDCASPPSCEGDFDRDGDVDGGDLAVFASDFGRTDCP